MHVSIVIIIAIVSALLIFGVYLLVRGIKERELLFAIVGGILILGTLIPTGYIVYDNNQKSECTKDIAYISTKVRSKEHTPFYMENMMVGKSIVIIDHPEQYIIKLQYKGVTNTFINEQLYNKLGVNDITKAYLITYKYKNGNIYKQNISLTK